jgi:hypothetical protein
MYKIVDHINDIPVVARMDIGGQIYVSYETFKTHGSFKSLEDAKKFAKELVEASFLHARDPDSAYQFTDSDAYKALLNKYGVQCENKGDEDSPESIDDFL